MANKGALIAGAAAVALGAVLLLRKGAEAAPDEPGEGTIDIIIVGPDGQPVPQV